MRRGVRDATWKSHIVHSLDEIFAKGEDLCFWFLEGLAGVFFLSFNVGIPSFFGEK